MKPPPRHTANHQTGQGHCIYCGRNVFREKPTRDWRSALGDRVCGGRSDGRGHDVTFDRPHSLTPEHIEAWLKED